MVDGVRGVVSYPMKGARQGGAGGFIKGVGMGAISLFTRPAGGFVDCASYLLMTVKRCASIV